MTINEFVCQSSMIRHSYKVTQEVYDSFQHCSNDFNPLHTDRAYAIDKGFQGCVMYGNILNAFISHFVGMLLPVKEVMIQSQDIFFHKPLYLNDNILLEATVEQVSEAVNVVIFKLKFRRCIDDKVELVAKGHVQIGLLIKK